VVKKTITKRSDRHFSTCASHNLHKFDPIQKVRGASHTIHEKVAAEEEETLGGEEVRMMRRSSGGCRRGVHRGRPDDS
jgi:hypothetical protein